MSKEQGITLDRTLKWLDKTGKTFTIQREGINFVRLSNTDAGS